MKLKTFLLITTSTSTNFMHSEDRICLKLSKAANYYRTEIHTTAFRIRGMVSSDKIIIIVIIKHNYKYNYVIAKLKSCEEVSEARVHELIPFFAPLMGQNIICIFRNLRLSVSRKV